jgi:Cu/Ag efflux pump CusA
VRDVATVKYGPALRRGEAVGGVVILRVRENAEKVIERVKEQIHLSALLAFQIAASQE